MNISALNKYIIIFLFAAIIIVSIMLIIFVQENKTLHKRVAIQQEQIVLRDASIAELEKNINALQLQVIETEKTCNLRIKAREDSFYILNKNRLSQHDCFAGVDTAKLSTPAGSIQNKVDYDIVTKDKSNFAINSINNYWNGLLTHTSNNEK